MRNLHDLVATFNQVAVKTAAKDKVSRKQLTKMLEKSKQTYGKLKSECDSLEKQFRKLEEQLTSAKAEVSTARKQMLKLSKAAQDMDLSGATDVVFYQENDEVGFVFDGKEYHVSYNDSGDPELELMNKHRRKKKEVSVEENPEVLEEELSEDDVNNLYSNLTVDE